MRISGFTLCFLHASTIVQHTKGKESEQVNGSTLKGEATGFYSNLTLQECCQLFLVIYLKWPLLSNHSWLLQHPIKPISILYFYLHYSHLSKIITSKKKKRQREICWSGSSVTIIKILLKTFDLPTSYTNLDSTAVTASWEISVQALTYIWSFWSLVAEEE